MQPQWIWEDKNQHWQMPENRQKFVDSSGPTAGAPDNCHALGALLRYAIVHGFLRQGVTKHSGDAPTIAVQLRRVQSLVASLSTAWVFGVREGSHNVQAFGCIEHRCWSWNSCSYVHATCLLLQLHDMSEPRSFRASPMIF